MVYGSYCVLFLASLLLIQVQAKNIADIETYFDNEGRPHKRFVAEHPVFKPYDDSHRPVNWANMMGTANDRENRRPSLQINDLFDECKSKETFLGNKNEFHIQGYRLPLVPLNSTLPSLREVEIFANYARTDKSLSDMFGEDNEDLIVIAPTNNAIMKLSAKPWQFPIDIESLEDNGAPEEDIDDAIQNNVSKFVRSHVVSYNTNKDTYKKLRPGVTLLRSLAADPSSDGDILLKRDSKGSYYVASIIDKKFSLVKKIENSVNGIILIVDLCMERPA
ncbi:hypothetical protein Kpol_526p28 [Vanderwaltozyma polyspora DSM 70294]|uniref:FAS1 domain-containing protein n=1 Tax=Vanderwaltozyma polyspora (strain ATCC 22028 / DSM 70294 / BCRC 21397 / CBS 2163 / NBRC 10782 / NRRL Y-8283 / UCD 57-17) TaxID=436907 RepID=A7TLT3_VANPO|nr:uncharacterized protein Kpol_526p28 [Vanderwaltozyma polyspora DSM 70294]EDO16775.1 hypothetical protein Kpol_526p28 [Vanderwaltozyma polyspora DSM 70294]